MGYTRAAPENCKKNHEGGSKMSTLFCGHVSAVLTKQHKEIRTSSHTILPLVPGNGSGGGRFQTMDAQYSCSTTVQIDTNRRELEPFDVSSNQENEK